MSETTTKRPSFGTINMGKTNRGPHAFQLHGVISQPPELKTGEKGPYIRTSIGLGGAEGEEDPGFFHNAWAILARAEGNFDRNGSYPTQNFMNVTAFGDLAERLAKYPKGTPVLVTGSVKKDVWTGKDGAEHTAVAMILDEFSVPGSRAEPDRAACAKTPVPVTQVFVPYGKTEQVARPYACQLAGNVYSVEPLAVSEKSGKSYLRFTVFAQIPALKLFDLASGADIKDKTYDDKKTMVRCTAFGKTAERLAKIVHPKGQVVLSGPISKDEYNGKEHVNVIVDALDVLKWGEPAAANTANAGSAAPAEGSAAPTDETGFADLGDDDSDLPF